MQSNLDGVELAGELAPALVPRAREIELLLAPIATRCDHLVHVEAVDVRLQRVPVRKPVSSTITPLCENITLIVIIIEYNIVFTLI